MRASTLLILPVGAVEQHGPHLPLGTDSILVEALCHAAVDHLPGEVDAVLLPTLPVGRSLEHLDFPGTLSLSSTTLLAVLDDLAMAVSRWPGRRLVLVNGHGGNTPVLQTALRDLRGQHGLETFLLRPFADLRDPTLPPTAPPEVHGGATETSLMLHVAEDLVDLSLARPGLPAVAGDLEHVRIGGAVGFGWLMSDLNRTGVVGDPTLADEATGAELFEQAVTRLQEQLAEISRFTFQGRA